MRREQYSQSLNKAARKRLSYGSGSVRRASRNSREFNDMLGIEPDSYNGESFYSDKMPRFEKELSDKGTLQNQRELRL